MLELDEIPGERLDVSVDGKWAVGWWRSYHREDRYEDVTDYIAAVFSRETGERVQFIHRRHDIDHYMDTTRGSSIYSAKFSEDGRYVLINGGKTEEDRVPLEVGDDARGPAEPDGS